MMLELGDDGVFKGVSEEELVYVDKNDLEELLNRYANLEKKNERLQTKNNAYLQDIEVFKEENTTLKLENERLKQQLEDITLNWTENYTDFDKDELYVKDNNTEIILKNNNLLISVVLPQIKDRLKFHYIVTGRRFEREC